MNKYFKYSLICAVVIGLLCLLSYVEHNNEMKEFRDLSRGCKINDGVYAIDCRYIDKDNKEEERFETTITVKECRINSVYEGFEEIKNSVLRGAKFDKYGNAIIKDKEGGAYLLHVTD